LSPDDVCGERLLARHDNGVLALVRGNDSVLIVTIGNNLVRGPLGMWDWYDRAKHLMGDALWTHSRLVWNLVSGNSIWHVDWHPSPTHRCHLLIAWWNHLHWNRSHVGRDPFRAHHLIYRNGLSNEGLPLWEEGRLHVKTG